MLRRFLHLLVLATRFLSYPAQSVQVGWLEKAETTVQEWQKPDIWRLIGYEPPGEGV